MTLYCVWPDGSTCELSALDEYSWKSDDFTTKYCECEHEAEPSACKCVNPGHCNPLTCADSIHH